MLILASANDRLRVSTGGTGPWHVHASYLDNVAGTVAPGRKNTLITLATSTDVVLGPAAGTFRNVKTLHVRNLAATAQLVSVEHFDGTNVVQLHALVLPAGATLQYIDEVGFLIANPPAPGTRVLLSSQTVTVPVAAIAFASGLDAAYDEYSIHIYGVNSSADDALFMRVSDDGGATYKSDANYQFAYIATFVLAPTPSGSGSAAATQMPVNAGMGVSAIWNSSFSRIALAQPAVNGIVKQILIDSVGQQVTGGTYRMAGVGHYQGNLNPINALAIYCGGGANIVAGTFNLYGIKK